MANNPSYGKYASERTIFEDLVGAQFGSLPGYVQPPKEPKPATFKSYSAPVELNPFVNIEMLVVPPRDATQEALNEYGRRGYLSRGLIADSRIREQEVLQQTVESKVNSIVNDEFERRRAVRRGVYEATGMTPAEIDEKFASDVLAQRENAVQRATTDGQVRDALIRYFTLRGGVVPAYLQPPPIVAPTVNNEAGVQTAEAEGLPKLDADNTDPFAGIDPFEGLAPEELQPPAPAVPGLSPADEDEPGDIEPTTWDYIMDLRDFPPASEGTLPRGVPLYKDHLARFLVQVGALGVAGRPLTIATWKKQSLSSLVITTYRWLIDHPGVRHPGDLGGGASAGKRPAPSGGVPVVGGGSNAVGGGSAPLPPRGGAEEGGAGLFDDDW